MISAARINVVLALLLAGLLALHFVVRPHPELRNFEILRDMVDSQALNAQTPPPDLGKNRRLDTRPPAGAIARGFIPVAFPATPEGAVAAGKSLRSPLAPAPASGTDANLERGRRVFETFCQPCHGVNLDGESILQTRGVPTMSLKAASSSPKNMPDGAMFHLLTFGRGNMPSYAAQIDTTDRWRVIRYVRFRQGR